MSRSSIGQRSVAVSRSTTSASPPPDSRRSRDGSPGSGFSTGWRRPGQSWKSKRDRDAMMKIVVTGGLGHIGSRLIRDIPGEFPDTEIVILDNLSTQRYCSLFHLPTGERYRFMESDILTADL